MSICLNCFDGWLYNICIYSIQFLYFRELNTHLNTHQTIFLLIGQQFDINFQSSINSLQQVHVNLQFVFFSSRCCYQHSKGRIDLILFDLLCLTPLSAIFQLYHGDQYQWLKKPEYPELTTDHGQATGKLYHLRLGVESFCNLQSRARTHAVLVIGLYKLLGNPTS